MWDSQKKQKINKSAQILGQSGAVQFNNIVKRFPGRIHRFHIFPGYCSIDRVGFDIHSRFAAFVMDKIKSHLLARGRVKPATLFVFKQ